MSIATNLAAFVPVVLSLSVHEWAHARAAWALGDDTAERLGRLTLNPLAHLDPIGSLLPLLGVPFGWAKPVPINPSRFDSRVSMGTGLVITAAAGPLSNFVLAALCLSILAVCSRFAPDLLMRGRALSLLLVQGVIVNLMLGTFNLLPIPPLDGSRVVDGLLPFEWRGVWDRVTRFGWVLLLFVLVGLPWMGVDMFGWVRRLSVALLVLAHG